MLVEDILDSDEEVPEIFYEVPVPLYPVSPVLHNVASGSALGLTHSALPSLPHPSERAVVSASKPVVHHASRAQLFQEFRDFSKKLDLLLPDAQALIPIPHKRGRPKKGFF